jgi:hypothetical protein
MSTNFSRTLPLAAARTILQELRIVLPEELGLSGEQAVLNGRRTLRTRLGAHSVAGHGVVLQRRPAFYLFGFPLYSARSFVFFLLRPRQLFLTLLVCLISHTRTITDTGMDGNH